MIISRGYYNAILIFSCLGRIWIKWVKIRIVIIHVCKFLDANLGTKLNQKIIHDGFHANSLNLSFRMQIEPL